MKVGSKEEVRREKGVQGAGRNLGGREKEASREIGRAGNNVFTFFRYFFICYSFSSSNKLFIEPVSSWSLSVLF